MKALTIWQPWASLIAIEAKPYEFRGWPAPRSIRGQRIAIHAGARHVSKVEVRALLMKLNGREPWLVSLIRDKALPLLELLSHSPGAAPLASIVATAVVADCVRADKVAVEFGYAAQNDSDRQEHFNWAWKLTDVQPLRPIVPAKGMQGLWDWKPPAEIAA